LGAFSLDAFAELLKVTIILLCLSTWNNSASTGRIWWNLIV